MSELKFILKHEDISDLKDCVLYFYAPWMTYHKKMIKILNSLSEKYKDLNFYAIDCDSFKSLAKAHGVEEIPTIIIYDSNKKIKKIVGLIMSSALKNVFTDIFTSKPLKGDSYGKEN